MPEGNFSRGTSQAHVPAFRLPIEPSDYPDRSPLLSQEERQEIASLLTLSDGRHFHAFEQHARRIERLTQPLFDVLMLYHQRWPTRFVSNYFFVSYFLEQVLQANMLYWGWSHAQWEAVIDAVPLRPNNVALRREPGYTPASGPYSLLTHVAAYLFAGLLYPTGKRCFPGKALGEIVFGQDMVDSAIHTVIDPWLMMGYAETHMNAKLQLIQNC